jgi:Cys-rich four helix bundle protein (predicted Tat secretion target)
MNRREALLNSSAMVVAASLGAVACAAQNAVAQVGSSPPAPADASLTDAAFDCHRKGAACADHCVRMLTSGDTSMAECMLAVRDMIPSVEALGALAANGSKHLQAAARLALAACQACEAACRKHAAVHAVCRDCADSCARTIAACQKAVG